MSGRAAQPKLAACQPTPSTRSPTRGAGRHCSVLSLSLLIIGLDNTSSTSRCRRLQKDFDASGSTLQWIVDAYLLVFAGLLLTMGTLGDRFGRKPALQAGLVHLRRRQPRGRVRPAAEQLIALRAVMGVGGALIMPATLSIITNVFPREERGKAIGDLVRHGRASASASARCSAACCSSGSTGARCSRQRAGRGDRDRRRGRARPGQPGPASPARSTSPAPSCRSARSDHARLRDHRGAGARLDRPDRARRLRRLRRARRRVRWLGADARRTPMLPLDFFRNPRFSVASLGDRACVVLLAVRARSFALTQFLQGAHGLQRARGGRGDDPAGVRPRRSAPAARPRPWRSSARRASSRPACCSSAR